MKYWKIIFYVLLFPIFWFGTVLKFIFNFLVVGLRYGDKLFILINKDEK